MSDDLRASDEERLRKISRVNMHRWNVPPTDEPETFFLLRLLAARVAALREARAEIERLRAQLAPATREHAVTRPVLAISTEDLIHRLRQHIRNRGAPHLPNGSWALMLEAANQLESALPPPPAASGEGEG